MYDFIIIGGGIVGLSTGLELIRRFPFAKIAIMEKENKWARHQTGHNSGVIHSGIYYKPGTLKAKLAREGNQSMIQFCKTYGIKYEVCGKVIVATNDEEIPLLEHLYKRGRENQLNISKINSEELKEIEPHFNGKAAIKVPSAGIVDFKEVAEMFASLIEERGGELFLNTKVENFTEYNDGVEIITNKGAWKTRFLINCAGLYSDRIAKKGKLKLKMKIIPFRGEYYELTPEKRHLVNNLIYPVPNPEFPFLGVHLTRMIDGSVHAGPNAVLSFKREGYKRMDLDFKDLVETFTYPGFWMMASKHMKEGFAEMLRSFSKKLFTKSVQKLVPEIQEDDLIPTGAGVRAQALTNDGKLLDDFLIVSGKHSIHVCNAPSPAATASIEIGKEIVKRIPQPFHFQLTISY
jgi:(S)-2-hydroxyglutarate dehydrogenase